MKMQHFVDEAVLADLLKKDPTDCTWKTMYGHYKPPFVAHFEGTGRCPVKCQVLFQEMFALLVTGIRENLLKAPFHNTLFDYLVTMGESHSASKDVAMHEPHLNVPCHSKQPFLAGEVLLKLLANDHEKTVNCIYHHYKKPVYGILLGMYRLNEELLEETYGDSIAVLCDNVRQGKLEPPLRSRLFTYFFRVMRNKTIEYAKGLRNLPILPDNPDDIGRWLDESVESQPDPDFDERLPITPELLKIMEMVQDTNNEIFERLIESLNPVSREVLWLYFMEGQRFKEIGERLNMKENAARKRMFDSLKKLRKYFGVKKAKK